MHFHMADQREPIIIGLKSVSLLHIGGAWLYYLKTVKDENQYNYQVKLP